MNKTWNITYYVSTVALSFGMLMAGYLELSKSPEAVELFTHLGYPIYLLYILGVWKIIGVIGICQNKIKLLREWAYAGFFFDFSGAFASHLIVGDGPAKFGSPFVFMVILALSYVALRRRELNRGGASKQTVDNS
jgi:hypothetical protein